MPEQTADDMRAQARRCRRLAKTSLDPWVIKTLNDMADGYEREAELLTPNRKHDGG